MEKRKRRVRKVDLGGNEQLELVRIKAGSFMMGSPDTDKEADSDEKPRREVEITNDFYMGKYHVTKAQFARFVAEENYKTEAERDGAGGWGYDAKTKKFTGPRFDTKSGKRDGGEDTTYSWRDVGFAQADSHPVLNVSYNDAMAFCKWLSKKTGKRVELPTEAEYEYCVRGGSATRYFTGDDAESLDGYANISDASAKKEFPGSTSVAFDDGYVFTSPVGRFKPNGFGLYDMTGNAYSWCADYYGKYENVPGSKNPFQSVKQDLDARVLRGGSWSGDPRYCRCADRDRRAASPRDDCDGFRVVFRLD